MPFPRITFLNAACSGSEHKEYSILCGGVCCPHPQGKVLSKKKMTAGSACDMYLLDLSFGCGDAHSMFLRNTDELLLNNTVLQHPSALFGRGFYCHCFPSTCNFNWCALFFILYSARYLTTKQCEHIQKCHTPKHDSSTSKTSDRTHVRAWLQHIPT